MDRGTTNIKAQDPPAKMESKPSSKAESTPAKVQKPLEIVVKEGQDPDIASAKAFLGPHITNANAIRLFGKGTHGQDIELGSFVTALVDSAALLKSNDLTSVEAMLMSQATALNVMFGELTRRSALNLNAGSEYRSVMEGYFKMAMKAQNQCRMTLETLSNIKNPPVVYAKQANITNGPQQVNNGSMPRAHAEENQTQPSKLLEQSYEQRLDTGTESQALGGDPPMEAMAESDRPQDSRG